jgi:hypothetical protein
MIERGDGAQSVIEAECDECNYEEQQISTEELTKPGPPFLNAALASHPEGDLGWAFAGADAYNVTGVKTIEQQGRDVKVVGSDAEPAFLEEMLTSPEIAKATVWSPFSYLAWAGVDEVVRVVAGKEVWNAYDEMPVAYIDTKEEAEAALAVAPEYYSPPDFDYEKMFEGLWSGK